MKLPNGWAETPLEDIAIINSGFGFPKEIQGKTCGAFPFAKVSDISRCVREENGKLFSASNYIDEAEIKTIRAKPVPIGSVVFAKIGEALRLNRRAIVGVPVIIDNNVMALTPKLGILDSNYLYRWMNTVDLSPLSVATTVPSVRRSDVAALGVPLPPLTEQHRIVAKLDALTARVTRARTELDVISKLTESLRDQALKLAFRGALTHDWEKNCNLAPVSPRDGTDIRSRFRSSSENEADLPFVIPASWRWFSMPQIGDLDRGKSRHRPRNDRRLFGGQHPFIQTGDVRAAGQYLKTFAETYSDFGLAQSRKWPCGTICITIAANIAETTILGIEACFPDSIVGFIPDSERALPEYIEYFIRTAKSDLSQFAPATAQKNINLEILSSVMIPIPPLDEQCEIVERLNAAFTRADRLEAEAARSRKLLDLLESAILAKAFRGELVPQDPNEEPASALLDRIRAQRAKAPVLKRGRTAKAVAA